MENRLLTIELSGFKSIRHASLELRAINLLIGANGAGKSNLISFFKLLNALCAGRLQAFVGEELGGANSALHFGVQRTGEMKGTVTFAGKTGENRYEFRLAHGAGDRLVFLDERIQYCKKGTSWQTARTYSLGAGHFESLLRSAKSDVHGAPLPEKTAGVMRHLMADWRVFQFHDTSRTARIKLPAYVDNKDYLWPDGGNLAAVLLFLRQTRPTIYEDITATVRRVLPSFGDFSLSPHPNTGQLSLNWTQAGGEEVFGPHQLSDGSLRFMALTTLLLQPSPPPLVLIDEPELGLHPYAVELLAAMLRSVSQVSQVMVSTQSAGLANHFQPEDVVIVDSLDKASRFSRLDPAPWKEWLREYGLGELWVKNLVGGTPA